MAVVPKVAVAKVADSLMDALSIVARMIKKNNKRVTKAELNKIAAELSPADSKLLDEQVSAGLNKVPKNKETAADNIGATLRGNVPISKAARERIKKGKPNPSGLTDEQEYENMISASATTRRGSGERAERAARMAAERAKDTKSADQIKRETLAAARKAASNNKNKGGMATKSNKGHMDYRKGGLVLSSIDNRKNKK